MKRSSFHSISMLLAISLSLVGACFADVVHLANGRAVNCELLKWDDTQATIRYMVPSPLGGAGTPTERAVPWSEIASIDFTPVPAEAELLRKATAADNAEMLLEVWGRKKSMLGKPESGAGEIGLVYATLLSTKTDAPRLERALAAFQLIEEQDWNKTRKGLAALGKVKVWLHQGKFKEADTVVQKMIAETEDPAVQLEAHQVLAKSGQAKLQALESEHPKWEEEDDIKPQRMELYQSVRDALLYPLLFQGADESSSARSLWELVQFLEAHGDADVAEIYAKDISKLYPKMPEADLAGKWLAKRKS